MSLVGTLAFYIEKTAIPPSEDKAENELFINELNGLALGPIIVHDDIPLEPQAWDPTSLECQW